MHACVVRILPIFPLFEGFKNCTKHKSSTCKMSDPNRLYHALANGWVLFLALEMQGLKVLRCCFALPWLWSGSSWSCVGVADTGRHVCGRVHPVASSVCLIPSKQNSDCVQIKCPNGAAAKYYHISGSFKAIHSDQPRASTCRMQK